MGVAAWCGRGIGRGRADVNCALGIAVLMWAWLHCCGWGNGCGCASGGLPLTHLLQLHPHLVEGAQPVGLGPGHGVLAFLAFFILSGPETEEEDVMSPVAAHYSPNLPPPQVCHVLDDDQGPNSTHAITPGPHSPESISCSAGPLGPSGSLSWVL